MHASLPAMASSWIVSSKYGMVLHSPFHSLTTTHAFLKMIHAQKTIHASDKVVMMEEHHQQN
jgi:hypothetical protein